MRIHNLMVEVRRSYLQGISKISSCVAAVSAILLLLLMIILNRQSPLQDFSVTVMVNILFHPLAFKHNLKGSLSESDTRVLT
jgi:hypothetical protein